MTAPVEIEHTTHQAEGVYVDGCAECEAEETAELTTMAANDEGTETDERAERTLAALKENADEDRELAEEGAPDPDDETFIEDSETPTEIVEAQKAKREDRVVNKTETIREEVFEPGDTAADAQVATRAKVLSFAIRDATNGVNIGAQAEVDAYMATGFQELIDERLFRFVFGKQDYGICRVVAVGTKADADNMARTKVNFVWSADERATASKLTDVVGAVGLVLELHEMQLSLNLTERA